MARGRCRRRSFQRQEEVQRVHRGDADAAADVLRRLRPRVDRRVVGRAGRLDAVEAEVEPEHAYGVRDGVAAAEPVQQRERVAVRMPNRRRVLDAEAVVERDSTEAVRARSRVRRCSGLVDGRPGEGPGLAVERKGEHHLAEALVVEVLGDDERLRESHEHPFVALREVAGRERHRHVRVGDAAAAAGDDVRRRHGRVVVVRAVERRLVEALAGESGHPHRLPSRDGVRAAGEHEDAVRGRRVAVAGRVLEVEALPTAAEPSKSPTTTPSVVTVPVIAAAGPLPWMLGIVAVTGSSHGLPTPKLKSSGRRHLVGRIDRVLVRDLRREIVTVHVSPNVNVGVRIQRERRRAAAHGRRVRPLVVHEIVNHDPVAFTGSLKVIEMFVPAATFDRAVPRRGVETVGGVRRGRTGRRPRPGAAGGRRESELLFVVSRPIRRSGRRAVVGIRVAGLDRRLRGECCPSCSSARYPIRLRGSGRSGRASRRPSCPSVTTTVSLPAVPIGGGRGLVHLRQDLRRGRGRARARRSKSPAGTDPGVRDR